MGAQFSKTAAKGDAAAERPGEAAVASSPSKANGQENGHVKVNGDASPAVAEPGAKEELRGRVAGGSALQQSGGAPRRGGRVKRARAGAQIPRTLFFPPLFVGVVPGTGFGELVYNQGLIFKDVFFFFYFTFCFFFFNHPNFVPLLSFLPSHPCSCPPPHRFPSQIISVTTIPTGRGELQLNPPQHTHTPSLPPLSALFLSLSLFKKNFFLIFCISINVFCILCIFTQKNCQLSLSIYGHAHI